MIRWGEPVTFYLELWLILGHMNDSKDSTVKCYLKISFSRWHTRFSILAGVLRDSGFCSLPLLSFLLTVPWKCSVSFLCSDSSLNNTVQVTGTWKPNSPVRPWSWGLSTSTAYEQKGFIIVRSQKCSSVLNEPKM